MRLLLVLLAACGVDEFSDAALVAPTVDDDHSLPALDINGTRLHVESVGPAGAPVILFLHGGPGGDIRLGISFPEIREGVEIYTVGMGATFFSYLGQS